MSGQSGPDRVRARLDEYRGLKAPQQPLVLCDGPARHAHTLPDDDGLRDGAVARCPGCGRFFVLDRIPWERTWRQVRWWDRRARRVIRERTG